MFLDVEVPQSAIARTPHPHRSRCKLLHVDVARGEPTFGIFSDLKKYLRAGDILAFNEAKVDPNVVKFEHKRHLEEMLILEYDETNIGPSSVGAFKSRAIVSGKRLELGKWYATYPEGLNFRLDLKIGDEGSLYLLSWKQNADEVKAYVFSNGKIPIPPYIRKARKRDGLSEWNEQDLSSYQTVYAKSGGSVAAPTAGLHFDDELLDELKALGVEMQYVHLKVGLGTFAPVTQKNFEEQTLHKEYVEISATTARALLRAKQSQRRIYAVGTTSVRAIEWWQRKGASDKGIQDVCDLFLFPPWKSSILSGMITNFHLPDSSLALLVAGFLGDDGIRKLSKLYQTALEQGCMFYSYGDAMFLQKDRP